MKSIFLAAAALALSGCLNLGIGANLSPIPGTKVNVGAKLDPTTGAIKPSTNVGIKL